MDRIKRSLSKKAGIYCIINTVNGKRYIGSSKNLQTRLFKHRAVLRHGKHENAHLQNAWNKYGEDNFQYFIVEFCAEDIRFDREQFYIDTMKPEYNLQMKVDKSEASESTRAKMSKSRIEGFKKGTVKLYQEKPIYQYSLEGTFIKEFKNIKEAAKNAGVNRSNINRYLSGLYKKGGNYLWSLTKVDSLEPYTKPTRRKDLNCKKVVMLDIRENKEYRFKSINECAEFFSRGPSSIGVAIRQKSPYLKRYMIKLVSAV